MSVLRNKLMLKKRELQAFIEELKARNPTNAQNGKFQCSRANATHCHKIVWNVFYTLSHCLSQFLPLPICTTNSETCNRNDRVVTAHHPLSSQVKICCFLPRNCSLNIVNAHLLTLSPLSELRKQLKAKERELAQDRAQITGELQTAFSDAALVGLLWRKDMRVIWLSETALQNLLEEKESKCNTGQTEVGGELF